jgi:hypothetical protein
MGALLFLLGSIIFFTIILPNIENINYDDIHNSMNSNNSTVANRDVTNTTNIDIITTPNLSNTIKNNKTVNVDESNNQQTISVNNLIVLGLIVLILLSPIIRSAKIGMNSLELVTIDLSKSDEMELEFIDR